MVTGSTPVLAASDVSAAVEFYKSVLGFQTGWTYGEPPTFGGASWGSVSIMFSFEPELAAKVEGHQLWIDVEDVDSLYSRHLELGAAIVSPIEDKPWERREYTVRDLNGYHLRFAGQPGHVSKGSGQFPEGVTVVRRMPTLEEYTHITDAASGSGQDRSKALDRSWTGVVAEDPHGDAIGALRIMYDASGWFSIWDVAVLPEWQGRRIGSAMMEEAMKAVRQESPGAFVYLFTFKGGFYERLGFAKQSHHVRKL